MLHVLWWASKISYRPLHIYVLFPVPYFKPHFLNVHEQKHVCPWAPCTVLNVERKHSYLYSAEGTQTSTNKIVVLQIRMLHDSDLYDLYVYIVCFLFYVLLFYTLFWHILTPWYISAFILLPQKSVAVSDSSFVLIMHSPSSVITINHYPCRHTPITTRLLRLRLCLALLSRRLLKLKAVPERTLNIDFITALLP